MGGGGRREGSPCRVVVLATMVACCIGSAAGICVVDNKKGWHLKCGVRDSYLFRLKDYGGLNANFDFSFGVGDETGFPFSIKNSKGDHHYYRKKDSTSRSSAGEEGGGGGGSGSQLHPSLSLRPPPLGQSSLERSSSIGRPSSERGVPIGPPITRKNSGYSSNEKNAPIGYASPERGAVIGSSSNERNAAIGSPYTRSQNSGGSSTGGRSWSSWWPARRRSGAGARRPSSSSSSSFFSRLMSWLPWPFGEGSWFFGGPSRADSRDSHFRVIHEPSSNHLPFNNPQPFNPHSIHSPPSGFSSNSFSSNNLNPPGLFNPTAFNPFGFNSLEFDPLNPYAGPFTPFPQPPPPPPPQSSSRGPQQPTIGSAMGDVLKVAPNTPADTDHVPSFAAKLFVVREAPREYYPPGYKPSDLPQRTSATVEVPRTKFFCEEQRYLPGLYADTQLGCKVFHMCLPAAVGNTQTSFLCPNMTLFDQSILQCNWWYYVRCEDSPKNYDANLPLALSYRRLNAAQLPLTAVGDYNSLALLDVTARSARNLLKEDSAVGRIGLAAPSKVEDEDEGENATLATPNEDEEQEVQIQEVRAIDSSVNDTKEMREEKEEEEEGIKESEKEEDDDANEKEKQEKELRSPSTKVGTEHANMMNVRILSINKLETENEDENVEDIKANKGVSSSILRGGRRRRRKRRRRSSDPVLPNSRHFSSPLFSLLLHRRRNSMP